MSDIDSFLNSLARTLLAGPWTPDGLYQRMFDAMQSRPRPRWMRSLAQRLCDHFEVYPSPLYRDLAAFLRSDNRLCSSLVAHELRHDSLPELLVPTTQMAPAVGAFADCGLPVLTTVGELADWFGLSVPELAWFADCRGWERSRSTARLRHISISLAP